MDGEQTQLCFWRIAGGAKGSYMHKHDDHEQLGIIFRATNSVAREGLVDSILVAEETKHLELFFVQTQFIFNLSPVNDLKHLR